MRQAFIIIQIGNPELDKVCEVAIVPALKGCNLDPKRVDKHNEGRLLKSEIVGFIESSDIIIADLTNERPNCYLEVGYAMGLDKFRNLILTAREDHNQDSLNYKKTGPKIHFDLSGYDILFWSPNDLDGFKAELEKRVKRRLSTIEPYITKPVAYWDEEWISKHRDVASSGLKKVGKTGFMEVRMALKDVKINIPQGELLRVSERAEVHTFGWPIAVSLGNREEYRPRPRTDGIVAEIALEDRSAYDYWAIRKNGTFYLKKSIFEDDRKPGYIFFDTRTVRITEVLLYAARLYSGLKVPSDSHILIGIWHGGLKNRILGHANRGRILYENRKSQENEVYTEIETSVEEIEANLADLVYQFTQPLFILFEFFEIDKNIVADIANNYVAGKVV